MICSRNYVVVGLAFTAILQAFISKFIYKISFFFKNCINKNKDKTKIQSDTSKIASSIALSKCEVTHERSETLE